MGNADRKNGNAVDIELNMSDITPINNEPDHHARETLVLLASAIRNGWQIPDAALRSAPNIVASMLINGTAREKIRAAEVLIRMRDSNIAALAVGDKIERLDSGEATENFRFGPIEL